MSRRRSSLLQFLRDSWREWRSPELRVLAAALVIAVAAVAAVGFFTDRVERGMAQQATALLGGDLAVRSRSPIPEDWLAAAAERSLRTTLGATLPSVVFTPEDEAQLVSVRAVDTGWPLRGEAQVATPEGTRTLTHGPEPGTAWVDSAVLLALELAPGDPLVLGNLRLTVAEHLVLEPDRGSGLLELAPRVLIHYRDLADSGLIGPGSRVRYQFLVAGAAAGVAELRAQLDTELQPGQRLLDLDDTNPELRVAVERAERFLGLAALMAVLLAGAAIAVAAHHYANQRADPAAIMRTLGASGRHVLLTYFWRVLLLAFSASALGLALGFGAQQVLSTLLGEWLAADLPPPGWRPLLAGLGVGLITAVGFALPALLRIGQVSPLRVLQRNLGLPPASVWLSGSLALLSFGALLYWQATDPALALWVLAGTAASLIILSLLGYAMIRVVTPWRERGGFSLRFGFANLARRGGLSAIQMVAFSIGILALLLLGIVRVDLLAAWERSIPADAPNLFFINIQPGQEQAFADRVAESGLPRPMVEPMIRGRLVTVNGTPLQPEAFANERDRRLLEREFNLSYATTPPGHNRVSAGTWFDPEASGIREWSVESGLMERFGLNLGDELSFNIGGQNVSGQITSVREVDWDSFKVNFFVIGNPALLRDQPRTYITSLRLPEGMEAERNQWLRAFPSVTPIDVAALLAQVRRIIDQAARAVEYVFLFTLLAGLAVLYAAVQAARDARRRETALLRTLGAQRYQVRRALLAEFATLGFLSGLLAAILATLIGAVLAVQVFEFAYRINPLVFVLGIGGGTLGIALAGWLGTRKVLNQAPLRVLRGPE